MVDSTETVRGAAIDPEHPEARCGDCGLPNLSQPWWTSADRWRPFVTAKYGHDMILCPQCFVRCWEEQTGLVAIWRLEPDPATIRDRGHDEWVAKLLADVD
jgi:hypothetical protein